MTRRIRGGQDETKSPRRLFSFIFIHGSHFEIIQRRIFVFPPNDFFYIQRMINCRIIPPLITRRAGSENNPYSDKLKQYT
jgi:hypothetical protein